MTPKLVLKESLVFTGIVTGRAAAIYLGMMLLGISRRSIVSDWHGLDYPNLIAFHRVVGWWVLAMSILHSLAFGFYYLQKGGWFEVWQACLPVAVSCRGPEERDCWNILGLVNGFGVVATAVSILLGIFSQQLVRRGFYNLFYFTHLVSSFLFMLFCRLAWLLHGHSDVSWPCALCERSIHWLEIPRREHRGDGQNPMQRDVIVGAVVMEPICQWIASVARHALGLSAGEDHFRTSVAPIFDHFSWGPGIYLAEGCGGLVEVTVQLGDIWRYSETGYRRSIWQAHL